jgi:2-oxoglutarate ferredoxin oxidoreductase subunit alpha
MARICQTVIDELESEGISIGLFRPISLFPYPEKELKKEIRKKNIQTILTVEMSMGQMVEDVEKVVAEEKPVKFFGRTGGVVPAPEEVREHVLALLEKPQKASRPKTSKKTKKA